MSNAKSLMLQPGRPQTVEIDVNGQVLKVDIRVPSMGLKSQLQELGGGVNADGTPKDPKRMVAATLAMCCFEHGTLSKIFALEDVDQIAQAGEHIDALFKECLKRLQPNAEEMKGKSEATSS